VSYTDHALDLPDGDTAIGRVLPHSAGAGSGVGRLHKATDDQTDISEHLSEQQLAGIGADVVRDWRMDLASNKDWRTKAEDSLDAAAQEEPEAKDYPFANGSSNVRYPLLTISGLAFASRAAPAIMKGDEAVKVKTFGKDPQGKKQARAIRMAEYLNWKLFYGIDGWERDTDAMLHRLPAVGQHYRKVWWDPIAKQPCIESVSGLRLTIPADARSLKASPRITHDFDRYPYELQQLMKRGEYREVELVTEGEDDQALRIILEQHRMMDLDDDGLDEPYIVTVDLCTEQVLRVEEAFDEDSIEENEAGEIISIERWCPFVDYGFIPDPKGRAYSIGFGHLLTPLMSVINTTINMQIDAGHAQVAGGGFIGSEIRLQGAGQNGVLRFQPGEYKTVTATGDDLRKAIYERTFPEPSPVLFQLLGMLMEAAKDIASVNEAITGDAARTAPVGTTLALIEQGQQVFNGIYKRIYRALREEFKLFADCIAKYGGEGAAKEYARFCDVEPDPMVGHNGGPPMGVEEPQAGPDGAPAQPGIMPPEQPQGLIASPQAAPQPVDPAQLFKEDFASEDLDIRPVSDPSAVTKAQLLAKDQVALQFVGKGIYADDRMVIRQMLQDAGIEQAETWIPDEPPAPQPPSPLQIHAIAQESALKDGQTKKFNAEAVLAATRAAAIAHESTGAQADMKLAAAHAKAMKDLTTSAQAAAGLLTNLQNPDAEPVEPTATMPANPAPMPLT
jgi:chaperonin GroES